MLHVSRPIRWDSDHVTIMDDPTLDLFAEIVRAGALDRVHYGLDYFDGAINRIGAWVTGYRNTQKALLNALLTPYDELKKLQDSQNFTKLLVRQEELKTMPFGEVWNEFCQRAGAPEDGAWFAEVEKYEKDVLSKRV